MMRGRVEFVIVNALVEVGKCKEARTLLSQHCLPHSFKSMMIAFVTILRLKSHLTYAVNLSE